MYSVHEQIEASAAIPFDCPNCGLPAEIVDRFTLPGSPGPVEHVKITCIAGHWFTPPVDSPATPELLLTYIEQNKAAGR